jgi:hypothetical protein
MTFTGFPDFPFQKSLQWGCTRAMKKALGGRADPPRAEVLKMEL